MPFRLLFMGAADLAGASFRALLASNLYEVVAAVTQPDRPKGRDLKLLPSLVKQIAIESGVTILQPERVRDAGIVSRIAAFAPDLIVVVAYGQILPQSILALPKLGCLNLHTSILPKYRGAAPIQWAILNGESETGVTIMKMEAGLDTGDILAQERTPIGSEETGAQLHDRLAILGAQLLARTLPEFCRGAIHPVPQDNAMATYARKISREDGRMDWTAPATALRNRIRAFTPWPGVFVDLIFRGKPRLVKFWRATVESAKGEPGEIMQADGSGILVACGIDALRIHELQVEGGRKMSAAEFLAGHPLKVRVPWK